MIKTGNTLKEQADYRTNLECIISTLGKLTDAVTGEDLNNLEFCLEALKRRDFADLPLSKMKGKIRPVNQQDY